MLEKLRSNKFVREYFHEGTYQFWKIISIAVLACSLLVGVGFIITHHENNSTPTDKQVSLSNEDTRNIDVLMNSFVKDSGTWGGKLSLVNDKNIDSIIKSVVTNDKNKSKYFIDRQTAYKSLRDKYIKTNSALYFNDVNIGTNWTEDTYSINKIANFSVKDINFVSPKEGTYILGDKNNFVATVHVTFTNVQNTVERTATDSTWNGSYNLVSKTIKNAGDIKLAKVDGVWKVTDATNITHPYPETFSDTYGDGIKGGNEQNGTFKVIKTYRFAYDL